VTVFTRGRAGAQYLLYHTLYAEVPPVTAHGSLFLTLLDALYRAYVELVLRNIARQANRPVDAAKQAAE
jgi:hypothetical protein